MMLPTRVLLLAALLCTGSASADIVREIALPTNDIVYDPHTRRIYASVPSRAESLGNRIVVIDPERAEITSSVFVGSDPGQVALSDDGRYLYVALEGAAAVRRLDLPTLTLGPRFSTGFDDQFYPHRVADMKVQPGHRELVAIARQTWLPSYYNRGVVLFERGVPLEKNTERTMRPSAIEFSSEGDRLYGLNVEGIGRFFRLAVDPMGVSALQETPVFGGSYRDEIHLDRGRIYTSTGSVIDAATGQMAGQFPGVLPPMGGWASGVPDSTAGRMFFITGPLPAYRPEKRLGHLRVYDQQTFRLQASIEIPNVSGLGSSLLRWGQGGLAFRTEDDQLFMIRTDWAASPSLALAFEPAAVQGGGSATGRLELLQPAPAGGAIIRLESSPPGLVEVPQQVAVTGGSMTATFPVRALARPGVDTAVISAVYAGPRALGTLQVLEPVLAPVTLEPGSTVRKVSLPTNDILYDRLRGVILATVPGAAGNIGNSLTEIDPVTGLIVGSPFIGSEPGLMAFSGEGQFLYTALDGAAAMRRIDRRQGERDLQFWLGGSSHRGPYLAGSLAVAPGEPTLVAVSRRGVSGTDGIAVYDNGALRPEATRESADRLFWVPSPDRLFGQIPQGLFRVAVDEAGARLSSYGPGFSPNARDVQLEDGFFYTSAGHVVDAETLTVRSVFTDLPDDAAFFGLVAPDASGGRIVFLVGSTSHRTLRAYDLRSHRLLGSLEIRGVTGRPTRMIRWGQAGSGTGGVAFRTDKAELFLIQSPLISGLPSRRSE